MPPPMPGSASRTRPSEKSVPSAAIRDGIPANVITLRILPKHSSIKMFFLGIRAVAATEADQVPQRRRREQDYRPLCQRTKVQNRQIGPVPRNAGDPADAHA